MRGKAKQIGILWSELAKELELGISGLETKTEYNYLLNQFKKHNLIAKRYGEGAVKWMFYTMLKESLIKNPTVSPVCLLDNGRLYTSNFNCERIEECNESSEVTISTVSDRLKEKRARKISFEQKVLESMETRTNLIESIVNGKTDTG
jgi:hypothetical protein